MMLIYLCAMCLQKESLNKKERQAKEKHEAQGYGVHLTDAKKIISSHASSTIVQKPIMIEPLGWEWSLQASSPQCEPLYGK